MSLRGLISRRSVSRSVGTHFGARWPCEPFDVSHHSDGFPAFLAVLFVLILLVIASPPRIGVFAAATVSPNHSLMRTTGERRG